MSQFSCTNDTVAVCRCNVGLLRMFLFPINVLDSLTTAICSCFSHTMGLVDVRINLGQILLKTRH